MHVVKICMERGHFGDQGLDGSLCENVWFEVLLALMMKSTVFWDVMPCSLIEVTSLVLAQFTLQSWSWRHSPEQLVILYQNTFHCTPGIQHSYVRSWQQVHVFAQNNASRYFSCFIILTFTSVYVEHCLENCTLH